MRSLILLILGFTLLNTCLGQQLDNLLFHHIDQNTGLSQTTNGFIYKDSKGFVWISSLEGLNRYDGNKIKVYKPISGDNTSLFGNNIQSYFYEDADSNIWFSTYRGINCYVRKHDNFIHRVIHDPISGSPLQGYYIAGFDQKNEKLWVISEANWLYIFDIKDKSFLPVHPLFENAHRGYFQANESGAIFRFITYSYLNSLSGLQMTTYDVPGKFDSYTQEYFFNGKDNFPKLRIWHFYPEKENLIWIATDKGLVEFNPQTKLWKNHNQFKNGKLENIRAVRPYGTQYLILSTAENGVLFFDKQKQEFFGQHIYQENYSFSVAKNSVENVIVDRDGGIWLTVNKIGVDYTYPQKNKFEKKKSFSGSGVENGKIVFTSFVEKNDQEIWSATFQHGILVIDNDKRISKHITTESHPQLPSNTVRFMFEDSKSKIWILTPLGLAIYNPENDKLEQLTDNRLAFIHGCQLKNGKVLLSAYSGGVYEASIRGDGEFEFKKIEKINSQKAYTYLHAGEHNIVYGSEELNNVVLYDGNSDFKPIDTLPIVGDISSIHEPLHDSIMWIGTTYGLVKLNKYTRFYDYFSEVDGFLNSTIRGLLPDREGNYWISTNRGIAKFNPSNDVQFYNLLDGISSLEFTPLAYIQLSSGEIWFGSIDGFTFFQPQKVKSDIPLAKVQITEILINGETLKTLECKDTKATNVSEMKHIKLDYNQNTLGFEFAALEYSDPPNNLIRYRLTDYEDNWVEIGNARSIRLPNISYGDHLLEVQVANSDGVWNYTPLQLKIYINPPFYRTWWFTILTLVCSLGILWLIFFTYQKRKEKIQQLKFEKILALNEERLRIARDMHDDLGSGLSTLSLLSKFIIQKLPYEVTREELEKISSLSERLVLKVREVIWTVNTQNDNLEKLIVYLHQYATELLGNIEIQHSISLPDNIPDIALTGEVRRMIFLTHKEALNNIIKHARASKVTISIESQNSVLLISIADDGVGFNDNLLENSSGNGLANMRQRMSEIGGKCNFRTNDQGTTVLISVPF